MIFRPPNIRVIDRRVTAVGDWREVTLPFCRLFSYSYALSTLVRNRVIMSRAGERRAISRHEARVVYDSC